MSTSITAGSLTCKLSLFVISGVKQGMKDGDFFSILYVDDVKDEDIKKLFVGTSLLAIYC